MLKIKFELDSLEKLNKHIQYVDRLLSMQQDEKFQKYIQDKCLETVKGYAQKALSANGTSNAEYYSDYIESIKIREGQVKNGFEIVSNLTVEKPASKHSGAYTFSISLAFEYGTGIIGMGSSDAPSWYRYNVNAKNNVVKIDDEWVQGWWIPKEKAGGTVTFGESSHGTAVVTQGYEGMEIFRFSAAIIQESLQKWVNEYKIEE